VAAVARPVEALEPGRLQLLEAGVGEHGDLLVVAGEDHGVAGEVGRVAVVVEVVEVGEQEDRAPSSTRPRRLPGLAVALLEGAQLQRRPVSSSKFSSSRAVRPLNQRLGEASSRVT
jgi:hypothetical protein